MYAKGLEQGIGGRTEDKIDDREDVSDILGRALFGDASLGNQGCILSHIVGHRVDNV